MNIIESLFTCTSKCKLYIHTPTAAISERVQKVLFTLGYCWEKNICTPRLLDKPYVVVYRDYTQLFVNDLYDRSAYFVESDTFLHNSTLKKLH